MLSCSPNQAQFSFPYKWWGKVGEVLHSGGHQLLSFSSILTSVCMSPCRCPFFLLDAETIPKYSQHYHAWFSFTPQFITSHCLAGTRNQIELTGTPTNKHTHTFIVAAGTLFSCRCEGHPPGPFHEALSFLSAAGHSASIIAPAGRHWITGGEGKRLYTHLSLLEQPKRSWEKKKGSSSSASPSCFIINNLLSVCNGAVLLFPLPSFSDPSDGLYEKEGESGGAKRGRPGSLCVGVMLRSFCGS